MCGSGLCLRGRKVYMKKLPWWSAPISQLALILLLVLSLITILLLVLQIGGQGSTSTTDPTVAILTFVVSSITAVSALWNAVLSQQNASKLEELKQRLSLQFPALQETRSAAVQYYYSLSKLETNHLDQKLVEESEEAMAEAQGNVYFLEENYQQAWYRYWQRARFIYEASQRDKDTDLSKKWREDWSKDLAVKLKTITQHQV